MTERAVNDDFWGDSFVEELPKDAKYLYLWLMTNKRLNPSGIFEASTKAIAYETGIPEEAIPALFEVLKPKVLWCQENNLIWVKNFTRRQCKNAKFLLGAVPYLRTLKNGNLKEQFLAYNAELFSRYSIDMVSILYGYGRDTSDLTPPDLYTDTDTDTITGTPGGFSFVTFLYELHEKHIGKVPKALVPALMSTAQKYPEDMIRRAFDEMATKAEKPCWKYVQGILESWEAKGYQGQKGGKGKAKPEASPDEYVRRYGHLGKKSDMSSPV